ncbi:hypothetical protein [Amycolatopsis sp. NPDC051071]|uniref:hypothetical protein n=1 Tax=Amycolatopsis sp. NPDC051071 TaxID=3154637 RepID=UPI00342AE927
MSLLDFLKQEGAEIILEMIGYNDAVKCFTQGDVEACIWTIVNALRFANPIGLLTKGGKLVTAIAKIAGKVGKFLKRSAEAKDEVMAGRNAIHEAMRQCKLPLRPAGLAATTSVVMSDDSRKTTKDVVAGD